MEDVEVKKLLVEMRSTIDRIAESQEKTRRHAQWSFWIMLMFLALPALGLLIAVPSFLSTYATLQGI